ncbi:MAG: sulfite exporter TauE/SafE family protein [Acidimicrobiales bacterium]|nr:sulfite exporter TauE/SafE family protein [Acidimicrobiales bacterium]
MDLSLTDHALAAVAAVAAGLINAVAGGGTLITFPTLVALGVPAVSSNITNTFALCPGYFGGTFAQRDDLAVQRKRVPVIVVAAAVGGLLGSILLVASSEKLFRTLVPFLLLGACALLALGDRIKAALPPRPNLGEATGEQAASTPRSIVFAVFCIGTYAGYFGAGMGIIALAVLSLALSDSMVRINALKQLVAFTANVVAACFFAFSGKVVWSMALVMMPASLIGGSIGGRVVQRLNPWVLRAVVIAIGVIVALNFWFG